MRDWSARTSKKGSPGGGRVSCGFNKFKANLGQSLRHIAHRAPGPNFEAKIWGGKRCRNDTCLNNLDTVPTPHCSARTSLCCRDIENGRMVGCLCCLNRKRYAQKKLQQLVRITPTPAGSCPSKGHSTIHETESELLRSTQRRRGSEDCSTPIASRFQDRSAEG